MVQLTHSDPRRALCHWVAELELTGLRRGLRLSAFNPISAFTSKNTLAPSDYFPFAPETLILSHGFGEHSFLAIRDGSRRIDVKEIGVQLAGLLVLGEHLIKAARHAEAILASPTGNRGQRIERDRALRFCQTLLPSFQGAEEQGAQVVGVH